MKIDVPVEILMKGMVDYMQSHPNADMNTWSDGVIWLKNLIETSSTIETESQEHVQDDKIEDLIEEQVPTEFDTQDRYAGFLSDISSNYNRED